jgi:hypothetical protein
MASAPPLSSDQRTVARVIDSRHWGTYGSPWAGPSSSTRRTPTSRHTAGIDRPFFLTITDAIGQAGTFWMFAGFSVLAFVWITAKVPETKGRTLEEIEESFARPLTPAPR